MSLEHAGRKVASEIGSQSIPMAEEMTLTMAEMAYLPDRRIAFENFAKRTGLELIKSLATVLIQSEKYGTPLGAALACSPRKARQPHAGSREEGGLAAAQAYRADDPVLPARALRDHRHAGGDPGDGGDGELIGTVDRSR